MKKKKETYYYKRLKGIVVFRNNIEDVINILIENGLTISFQDASNTYENIQEVKENAGINPKKIIIEGRNNETYESVGLSFEKNELTISCHGSEQMYTLGFRLINYFSETIPWHYKVFNPWIYYFTTFTPLYVLTFAFDKITGELTKPWILILFGLSFLFVPFSYFLRKYAYGIKLIKSHEHGFWKRNKDNLIVSTISTIIGAILGVIGTLLVQYMSK